MNCPSCAAPCPDGAKFCPSCGYSLPKEGNQTVLKVIIEKAKQPRVEWATVKFDMKREIFFAEVDGERGIYCAGLTEDVPDVDRPYWDNESEHRKPKDTKRNREIHNTFIEQLLSEGWEYSSTSSDWWRAYLTRKAQPFEGVWEFAEILSREVGILQGSIVFYAQVHGPKGNESVFEAKGSMRNFRKPIQEIVSKMIETGWEQIDGEPHPWYRERFCRRIE